MINPRSSYNKLDVALPISGARGYSLRQRRRGKDRSGN